jgi:hypothetical protein
MITGSGYAESWQRAIRRCGGLYLQVIVMIRIGKFNTQLT